MFSIHPHLTKLSESNIMLIFALVLFILAQEKGRAPQAIAALEKIVDGAE